MKELQLAYKTRSLKTRNVVIVERQYRRILNIHTLAKAAEKIGFKNVRVLDLERMTMLERMVTIVATDILIGIQGQELQWSIFMRPGSMLVEISWPKKYWCSGYSFVQQYDIKLFKLETADAFVNWDEYESRWGEVSSPEEKVRVFNSPPRTHKDNIWKYVDVLVNVTDFQTLLKRIL